jgi:hypothetical protein
VRAAVVVGCDGYGSANASLAGAVRDALAGAHERRLDTILHL